MTQENPKAFVLIATEKKNLSDRPYQTVIDRLAQKSKTLHKLLIH
jgi:hypothetical protein